MDRMNENNEAMKNEKKLENPISKNAISKHQLKKSLTMCESWLFLVQSDCSAARCQRYYGQCPNYCQ